VAQTSVGDSAAYDMTER